MSATIRLLPVNWSFFKATAKSAIGASSLLWIGDVLGGDMPVRPMTCATLVCQGNDGLQARMFVVLNDLAPSPLTLLRSIPVTVQKEDDVFVVSFPDANINASGETLSDALEMLKDMIAFTYRLFSDEESVLGNGPRNELAALRRFVRT